MKKASPDNQFNRRYFAAIAGAGLIAAPTTLLAQDDTAKDDGAKTTEDAAPLRPREKAFERDYEPPKFKPSWKKEQVNRELAADFVIYAHSDLKMVEKLLERCCGMLDIEKPAMT